MNKYPEYIFERKEDDFLQSFGVIILWGNTMGRFFSLFGDV